jgi:hypothetical protein
VTSAWPGRKASCSVPAAHSMVWRIAGLLLADEVIE